MSQQPRRMTLGDVHLLLHGLSPEQQRTKLLEIGYQPGEIPDFLNFLHSRPAQESQPRRKGKIIDPNWMEKSLERIRQRFRERAENPEVQRQEAMDKFQRDVLHTQYLLGGSTEFDRASYWNPETQGTQAAQWMRDIFHPNGYRFALLFGGVGSGKTWAALAWLNLAAQFEINCGRVQRSNAAFIHAYRLAQMVSDQKTYGKELESLIRKPILLIDELGAEPAGFRGADFLAHLEYMVNQRHSFKVKTVITTNMSPEDFKTVYGTRITSRISEVGKSFQTTDGDFRQLKRTGTDA